ncbi:MAG: response regulator [bacterium]|nr:response regulator [bacterium]
MAKQFEIWGTRDPNISAQFALALKMDLFKKDAGLDISYRLFESGTTMPSEALNAAHKPFALLQTPITSILLHEKGVASKIVAPLADIAGTQQMIIHPDSGIVHPENLEGKRIGMARDAAVYTAVVNMSRDYGVDLTRVEFVDLLPHEQLAAFMEGRIDAMACWEPWTSRARNMGGKMFFSGMRSEISGAEGKVNWLVDQGCLIVPDENLERYPQEVVAVLKVLCKSTDLLNEHRQEVTAELADFFEMEHQELIMAMRKNLYSIRFDNLFRIGLLGFRDVLFNGKQVSGKYAEKDLYDMSFLRKVDASRISIEGSVTKNVSVIGHPNVYYRQDLTLVDDSLDIRFLITDDSKVVRSALVQMVEILGGHVVGEATNGQESIESFSRLRPNFITMDISMPGMSGVDAIKHILQQDPGANIIVVSATDLQELREEVFDLGVKIFIVKPFDPLLVAEIIGLLLL